MSRRHVLLIGLPGAGKSTAGRLAATQLGAPFIDIDTLLVRQMGRPIAQIFGMVGEAGFRQLERDAVAAALAGDPSVTVPGAGWAAQPGQLEAARVAALLIYLKVAPATAARRAEGGEGRPLLMGSDPGSQMLALFEARRGFYEQADAVIDADRRAAEAVSADVAQLARERGGW